MNQEMPAITGSNMASSQFNLAALNNQILQGYQQQKPAPALPVAKPEGKLTMATTARRLVQVFIADPNENVPLSDALLHSGEQKLTDLTDQELFFEIDIRAILAAHNEKRAKTVNKAVKERTEYLEPARIRDLKMTVVSIATF